jgi:hypothetical protein
VALETLNKAQSDTLPDSYKNARWGLEAALINEQDTLDSILELAPGHKGLKAYIGRMKQSVSSVGTAQLAALDAHMGAVAGRLGVKSASISLDDLEKKAAKIVPRPTSLVRENGYRGYQKLISGVPAEERAKYPFSGREFTIGNTRELQLLVNGKHSALDIKKMLDAQYTRKSSLQAVVNYLEILKIAGLVEW